MELSVPNHIKFLEHYGSTLNDSTLIFTGNQLYSLYCIFIKTFEANYGLQTSTKFVMEIKKYLPKIRNNGTKYSISRKIVIEKMKAYYKNTDYDLIFNGPVAAYYTTGTYDYDEKIIELDENGNVVDELD